LLSKYVKSENSLFKSLLNYRRVTTFLTSDNYHNRPAFSLWLAIKIVYGSINWFPNRLHRSYPRADKFN
jgi:hypothetical protein